jgi:hypothetical protein
VAPASKSGRRPASTLGGIPGAVPVLFSLLASFLASGCASRQAAAPLPTETSAGRSTASLESAPPPTFRAVYVIHGDADYLYHDAAGKALQADEEALRQAIEVAEQAPRSEVFIFHQGPAATRMFRSVPGGTFLYYRDGKLRLRKRYVDAPGPGAFGAEAALFQQYADDFAQPRRVFSYFGHEIPVLPRTGYFASRPDQEFSVARFADGLTLWARPTDGASKPFDLVVLSTCYGGTPPLLGALLPAADYVVASPANLHLSHLDTRPLVFKSAAEGNPASSVQSDTVIRVLADRVAARSFESLSEKTATEITVAVYDLEKARPFLESFPRSLRDSLLNAADSARVEKAAVWRDCERSPIFNPEIAHQGVRLWFRAPRFGPRKNVTTRSAWECAFEPINPSRP